MKLTEEIIDEACKHLSDGNYVVTVCDYLNIAETTWYGWVKRGKEVSKKNEENQELTESEALYLKFLQSLSRARAEAVFRNIDVLKRASLTDWKASAFWLERTQSKLYGVKQNITIEEHSNDSLDMDEVNEYIAEIKAKKELERNNTKVLL